MISSRRGSARAMSARAGSARGRAIITPIAGIAAQIQASYKMSRPMSSRGGGAQATKTKYIEEIEQYITDELKNCYSGVDEFRVYQEAFAKIIEQFEKHRTLMTRVKHGYDSIIEKLRQDSVQYAAKERDVYRSQTDLHSLVAEQREKYETKKRKFEDLEKITLEQMKEIQKEIDELNQQLTVQRAENRNADTLAHQQWLSLQELTEKTNKKQLKSQRMNTELEDLKEKEQTLQQQINELHDGIAVTLDSILAKKRYLLEKNKKIEELKDQIRRGKEMTQTKRNSITKVSRDITEMAEKAKATTSEINEINQANTSLMADICDLVQVNLQRSLHAFEDIDDPIKLLARYIEDCK